MLHSYGKRKDKDGLLIFFDSISRQVVWHKFIQSETKENYLEGLNFLLEKGFEILRRSEKFLNPSECIITKHYCQHSTNI